MRRVVWAIGACLRKIPLDADKKKGPPGVGGPVKTSHKRRGDLGDDQVAVLVESGNSGTRPAAHSERAICWRSAKDMYGDRMNSLAKVVCAAIKVLVAMTLALNIVVKNCVATGVSV